MKKIGKAKADSKLGFWLVDGRPDQFGMNPRLVDLHPEVKALKAVYSKFAQRKPPGKGDKKERDAYFVKRTQLKAQLEILLVRIYADILEESFSDPIPLYRDKSHTHHRTDWLYGLYKGIIYEFDKPNYTTGEMLEAISAYSS